MRLPRRREKLWPESGWEPYRICSAALKLPWMPAPIGPPFLLHVAARLFVKSATNSARYVWGANLLCCHGSFFESEH